MGRVCGVESHSQTQLRTPDVLLAELAAQQHGVVTMAQLLALGFGAGAIKYRVKVGRLHLLHRGVYAVGHRPPSPLATAMAAVLACGPDAALSHESAAALWRIVPRWPSPTHVTSPSDRRRPGIHVHRSPQAEATTHYGIRVTSPARTLVDLADVLTPKHLTRALNEAQVQRLTTPNELTTLFTRYPGRRTLATHARAGRHPLPPRGPLRPLPQTPRPATPGVQPTDSRPRSRRRHNGFATSCARVRRALAPPPRRCTSAAARAGTRG